MRSNEHPKHIQPPHEISPGPLGGPTAISPALPDKLIRIDQVCELTGLGKTSVYAVADFPSRVILSRRAVGWRLSEVLAWIESRMAVGSKS
jgi:predicted DNA-binding transcriptional regulator AlpA